MKRLLLASSIFAAIVGCGTNTVNSSVGPVPSAAPVEQEIESADQAFLALVDHQFMAHVNQSPEFQTYLGMKTNYDKWNDLSDESALATHELNKKQLKALENIDPSQLSADNELSYRMAVAAKQQSVERYKWRLYSYSATQMRGKHAAIPSFLINQHRIDNLDDAQAYVSRLNGIDELLAQVEQNLLKREEAGIVAPAFVFPMVINDCENIISGAPFDQGADSVLLADIKKKVLALDISKEAKDDLIAQAKTALVESVQPAYLKLIATLKGQQSRATKDDGVWKFPDGDQYYEANLAMFTTTNLSANDIHEIGLQDVARIHQEMRNIMKTVGFSGTLQEFFAHMRTSPEFYYETSPEGKQRYLDEATSLIDTMRDQLDDYFGIKPKADMIVKAVEPFREKSAGKAFYNRPAPDGSRPGIYYANLYNMADMPTYQMEALAYHEGIPGHHMQLAISQELTELPKFRRFGSYTAYTEGWGLYSEYLPKEMGFYKDPYSDFGRLAMELWRACRLVVDTGLHAKKWTREEAIQYLAENTPNPHGDVVKAIERYIVMPGQATAYKIGMIKILELREGARAQLGDKFDIRAFHDVVLGSGPVPLDILEENVKRWVSSVQ